MVFSTTPGSSYSTAANLASSRAPATVARQPLQQPPVTLRKSLIPGIQPALVPHTPATATQPAPSAASVASTLITAKVPAQPVRRVAPQTARKPPVSGMHLAPSLRQPTTPSTALKPRQVQYPLTGGLVKQTPHHAILTEATPSAAYTGSSTATTTTKTAITAASASASAALADDICTLPHSLSSPDT